MLSVWKAVLLGVVQGAAEFLPVSSSGHLVVIQHLLGWQPERELILAFDIALHVGTLLSVIAVFYRDLIRMITGKELKLLGYLILATIPAVIVGFAFKGQIERLFTSVEAVGIAWMVTGLVLLLTGFVGASTHSGVGWLRSLAIGCAQSVAIIPGISRSGSTIAVGLFLGLDKASAAKFAFLMSIPAIAGGALLDAGELIHLPGDLLLSLFTGVLSSAVVGYICIKWLLRIIVRGRLWWFGIYCLLAGALTIINLSWTRL